MIKAVAKLSLFTIPLFALILIFAADGVFTWRGVLQMIGILVFVFGSALLAGFGPSIVDSALLDWRWARRDKR